MHDDVLAGTYDGAAVVVGPTRRVVLVLADWDATIGSSGTVAELPRSFRRARQLFSLVASGALVRSGPVRWSDELAAVVVHAAPDAADELARRRLGPLADSNAARERWLVETLRAWLDTPGRPQAIAERLYLHPQTVRYRLRRLRERLGDDIDDPAARFEFAIALQFRDGRAGSVRVPRSEGAWQEH
jgi:DNA-binding PucR family transcriptional regulator